MALWIVFWFCLLLLAWILGKPYYVEFRRTRLRAQQFPPQWEAILRRRLPTFSALPADLRQQLKRHILVFVAEKQFLGCAGLAITDDMRVTIAAQACLLILNRKTDYFPGLERILVYPGAFVVDKWEEDEAGVLSAHREVLAGESWGDGQVILSWEDTLEESIASGEGKNIVIHEFAHQLDQQTGVANGAPLLASGQRYRMWAEVFGREFMHLRQQPQDEEGALFDDYAAEHPAEFFAMASEVFFERPREMAERHSALYEQLRQYYRVDPLNWTRSEAGVQAQ